MAALYAAFCRAVGRPELIDDERFATPRARLEHGAEMRELLEPWFAERTKHEAWTELAEAGVPAAATLDTTEVFNDPHLRARDFFTTVDHPTKGELLLMRQPFRMSDGDVPLTAAPLVGEHTRQVLADELGLANDEIDELIERGAVHDG